MSLYRGIAYIILGDGVYGNYPSEFSFFGQGYVWKALSFEFCIFIILIIIFSIILHKTVFGRLIYTIGKNPTVALFSGINIEVITIVLFSIVGVCCGLASVLLTSRIGSTRPSIAMGWELDIITMVILGGINILGGYGTILGVTLSIFLMGFVTFGMNLMNIPAIIMSIITGILLIFVIAVPITYNIIIKSISSK